MLIKTNHLRAIGKRRVSGEWRVASGERIQHAIAKAKKIRPRKFVEIEVCNFQEFKAALMARPDAILQDNWSISKIKKAVVFRNSSLLEVSGGVTLANVRAIARTGVDRISVGRLTHSAPALDVSLEAVR